MTETAGTPALELHDLAVYYGDLLALEVDRLRVEPGRVCGLIGMNGAGKSTLFKVALGAVRADRGTVRLGGLRPEQARRRGLVASVPQADDVDPRFPLTVGDVVMMGRYGRQGITRRPRPLDREAVATALDRVELRDLADRPIGALSGGQRKRTFVARAIAQDAQILLLDEPFAGVDRRSEDLIVRLLRELADDGRSVIVSTHDLHALPALADEAILLLRRVLLHAPTAEVLKPENLARAFGLGTAREGDVA
ncbi:metal ABC transporter ATP-binding protein [uncultured Schumannella sp.]|uniref:metal ABC transporter ATP-binding protein n=1 Tax=uncultured Schumannella sp. TaxID=1195956 RepID=UPI0025DBB44C|nr:metal ABC transporter ATP-binding protein [uncultured Schumannella sp.]